MLRTTLLVSASLLLATAALAAPTAGANHVGPCGHEYAEAVLWFALDHRSPKQLLGHVGACVDGTLWYVCHGLISCSLP